ncbi:EAL domain-containing protein [Nakamurella sp. A5-74]|uniref:EAL domain-containing protein n=1 Tax=Nakamurella sp. A5-74 TaxID=3158264 RepID=A0AAU8DMN0_9ACTN
MARVGPAVTPGNLPGAQRVLAAVVSGPGGRIVEPGAHADHAGAHHRAARPGGQPRTWRWAAVAVAGASVVGYAGHIVLAAGEPAAVATHRYLWIWLITGVLTMALILMGIWVHRPRRAWPWLLTAATVGLFTSWPARALGTGVPSADFTAFVVAGCALLLGASGVAMVYARGHPFTLASALDSAVIGIGYLGLQLHSRTLPAFAQYGDLDAWLYGIVTPIGMAISLVSVAHLQFHRPAHSRSFRYLLVGYLFAAAPITVSGLGVVSEPILVLALSTVPFVLLLGAAAVDPSMVDLTEPGRCPTDEFGGGWRFVVMVAATALPCIGALILPPDSAPQAWVVAAIQVMVIVLVVLRSRLAVRWWATATDSMSRLAVTDPLTSLANRRGLHEAVASLEHPRCAVLSCDLDGFSRVNTADGHRVGDLILRTAADRLRRVVPPAAFVGRLGGDEFAVVLPGPLSALLIAQAAEQIRVALAEPLATGTRTVAMTVSIGTVTSRHAEPPGLEGFTELLREAGLALRAAKDQGGNRVVRYSADLDLRAVRESAVQDGLGDSRCLDLHYQAIVDMNTRTVIGAEALLRLKTPALGSVPPSEFIPIAVRTGQIIGVGQWVLHRALDDLRSARDALPTDFLLSINVSARQLDSGDLVGDLQRAVGDDRWLAEALRLEITESEIAGPGAIDGLNRLVDAGFHVVIDDFGTQYASLQYLTNLPVETIKLDLSFVARIVESRADRLVVQHVIALGNDLGLTMVAEGVERQDQADLLMELGCPSAQGYLYDRPAPGLRRLGTIGSTAQDPTPS